ncbi:MAG: MATE family efflux transporter [Methanimicrococcus sp.]|nr:MATE family efflux transporter [Methanimicrococcus sp.]
MYERDEKLVLKKFREYLIPTILTSMAVSMSAVIDSVLVGNLLGDEALAAVSLSMPVIYCLNMIFMLFGVGGITSAVVAKGRREGEKANLYFTISLVFGTAAMLLFLIVAYSLLTPITALLAGGNAQMQILSADYLRPLLFTAPFLMISTGTSLFIRTDGSPKIAAFVTIMANAVKLVFCFAFIHYWDMGIAGAGLSTTVGYVFGSLLVIPYFFSKKRSFKILSPFKADFVSLKNVFLLGLPKASMQATFFLRTLILNSLVLLTLGSVGMSVMAVCMNVLIIANIFINGTIDTLLPIVGTLYGEKDHFGIRKIVKKASGLLFSICLILALFFIGFPQVVGGWFGIQTREGVEMLVPALRLFALCLPFLGLNTIFQSYYNTTGREKISLAMAFLNNFIFVAAFALLFVKINENVIWLCYVCAEISTLLFVGVIGMRISRRENVSRLLLLKEEENGVYLDVTIPATIEDSVGLSKQIIDFCRENQIDEKAANRIGVAIEEMATNTAKFSRAGNKIGRIDILVHIKENELTVRFRDDGVAFDPTQFRPEDETSGFAVGGIQVVKKISKRIEYSRQIGFNTTVMTFEKNVSKI